MDLAFVFTCEMNLSTHKVTVNKVTSGSQYLRFPITKVIVFPCTTCLPDDLAVRWPPCCRRGLFEYASSGHRAHHVYARATRKFGRSVLHRTRPPPRIARGCFVHPLFTNCSSQTRCGREMKHESLRWDHVSVHDAQAAPGSIRMHSSVEQKFPRLRTETKTIRLTRKPYKVAPE
jgi:hypothetical protein